MQQSRTGFTLIELVIVCVMLGGLAMIALPRLDGMREAYSVGSASQQFAASIASARAAAVQRGRPARFHLSGSTISAVVPLSPTESVFVVGPLNLQAQFGVTVRRVTNATDSILTFGPRGVAAPRLRERAVYAIRGATRADTVCVGIMGQLLPRGCAP